MKAPARTLYRLWTGTACLALAAMLTGCPTKPLPTAIPGPPTGSELPESGRISAQEAFENAEALRGIARHGEALRKFAEFIEDFPDHPLVAEARLAVGQLATILDKPEVAAAAYSDLISHPADSSLRVEAFIGLGRLRYQQKDYAASLATLRKALADSPTPSQRSQVHYHLGTTSLALRAYRDAVEELTQATFAENPELSEMARNLLVTVLQDHFDIPQLELLAGQFSGAFPGDLILAELAKGYRDEGDLQGENDALQRLLDTFEAHSGTEAILDRLRVLKTLLDTDPTKLGILLPLSGPTGQIGRSALHSIQLALDMFQKRHDGVDLSLVIRDTGATTETARDALRALVEEAHVIGVIGPLLSQTAEELVPLADQLAVPLFSPFARDSKFPQLSPYAFRNSLTDAMQGRLLASYATRQLDHRRFAILYPNDAYGSAMAESFVEALAEYDGRVVTRAAYPPDAQGIGRAINRIRAESYDALLVPDYADNIARLAPELAQEAAAGVQILGTDGWNDPEITTVAAEVVDGSVFVDGFFPASPVPHVEAFVDGYRDRHGSAPDLLAAQAFDTLTMCARVLLAGVRTRPEMRDGLARIRDFPGVSGVTSMDADGDAEKVLYVLSVRNGRIVQINAPAFRFPDAGGQVD